MAGSDITSSRISRRNSLDVDRWSRSAASTSSAPTPSALSEAMPHHLDGVGGLGARAKELSTRSAKRHLIFPASEQHRHERPDLSEADPPVGGPGGQVEVVHVQADDGRERTAREG